MAGREGGEAAPPKGTHHNKAHLAHGLLVVVVHLADEGVAQVHGDALDRLVLARGAEDAQQELVDPAVLEFQLLRDAEVTEGQTAVPLDLGRAGRQGSTVRVGLGSWTPGALWRREISQSRGGPGRLSGRGDSKPFLVNILKKW